MHVVNTCALTVEAERKSRRAGQPGRAARPHLRHRAAPRTSNAGQFAAPRRDRASAAPPTAPPRRSWSILGGGRPDGLRRRRARAPPGRTRAFLKVQNGCDSRCAFCIIPTTRGAAESRPLAAVLARRPPPAGGGPSRAGPDRDQHRHLARARERAPAWPTWCAPSGALEGLRPPAHLLDRAGRRGRRPAGRHRRDAGRGAASARPAAVRRRRGAAPRWAAPTAWPTTSTPAPRARAALPGLNLTTDAIVGFPAEDEAAFARTAAVVVEVGRSARCTCSRTPRGPARRPRRWPAACPPRRRASGRRGCATSPTALGLAHRAGAGGHPRRGAGREGRARRDAHRPRRRLHALRAPARGRRAGPDGAGAGARRSPASTCGAGRWRPPRERRLPVLPHRRGRDPGRRGRARATASWPSADIAPKAPVHLLVIPVRHVASIAGVDGPRRAPSGRRCCRFIAGVAAARRA